MSTATDIGVHFYGVSNTANAFNLKSSVLTITINYSYSEAVTYYAATGSVTPSTIEASGSNNSTVSIFQSDSLSGYSYIVEWKIGSISYKTPKTSNVTVSYTIPKDWCNAITSSTSGTATVTIYTYYGSTSVGYNSYTFKVTVPSSVVPSVSSISAAMTTSNSTVQSWNKYVQGYSGVTLTASGGAGVYGSTIRSYTFSGAGISTSSSSNTASIATLNTYGTLTFSVYVTDSRGRQSTAKTVSITVYECSTPSFTSATAYRTNSSGNISDSGTYISASAKRSVSSIGGSNTSTMSCSYKKTTATSWTTGQSNMTDETNYIFGGGNITTADSWQVQFTITDALGQTATKTVALGTLGYTMFFKKGGLGVGIGMQTTKAQSVGALEINSEWAVYHGDNIMPTVVMSSTQPTAQTGLIWLKPV